MSKRIFTKEQIGKLLQNPCVAKCSAKSITYNPDFKVSAVRQHKEQCATVKEIFVRAGFDLEVIGRETPRWCLKRWSRIYKAKGAEKLAEERRGRLGRPRTRKLTSADRIKRLKAENAYLKAENDFLAKLRAKRAE